MNKNVLIDVKNEYKQCSKNNSSIKREYKVSASNKPYRWFNRKEKYENMKYLNVSFYNLK